MSRDAELGADSDREFGVKSVNSRSRKAARSPSLRQSNHARIPASPSSVRTSSSNISYHTPISPSPLQYQYSTESSNSTNSTDISSSQGGHQHHPYAQRHTQPKSPPPVSHARWHSQNEARRRSSEADARESSNGEGESSIADSLIGGLDTVQQHYATAYSAAELKTFHCEQVRKMPMSGLDPSMLIGFLCRDEAEWADFRRRVGELSRTIFSIQDEPPVWTLDSDDNMGLESISDPEDEGGDSEGGEEEGGDEDGDGEGVEEDGVEIEVEGVDFEEEEEAVEEERRRERRRQAKAKRANNDDGSDEFFDTRSRSSAEGERGRLGAGASRSRSDTEEDPVGPITPGPGARFAMGDEPEDDDDDDWVDPSVPSPPPSRRSTGPVLVEAIEAPRKDKGKGSKGKGKERKKTGPGLVPVVRPAVLGAPQTQTQAGGGKKKGAKKGRHVRSGGWEGEPEGAEQEHYLFPSAGTDNEADGYGSEEATPLDRSRVNTATPGVAKGSGEDVGAGKRMNTARARDGGRTQSGGVKGVLTE